MDVITAKQKPLRLMAGLFSYNTRITLVKWNHAIAAYLHLRHKKILFHTRVHAWDCNQIYTLTTKDLQTGPIKWKEQPSRTWRAEQTQRARRRAGVEETEEKSGTRRSTDPKQKTQPDGDEDFCQYDLFCDACRLLRWRDRAETRLFEERWKKERRVKPILGNAQIFF